MMKFIGRSLAPGGTAILNTFCPSGDPAALQSLWIAYDGTEETLLHEDKSERIVRIDDCRRFQTDPLIVFPILTYRRYDSSGQLLDEAPMAISMRVWYPNQLLELVQEDELM